MYLASAIYVLCRYSSSDKSHVTQPVRKECSRLSAYRSALSACSRPLAVWPARLCLHTWRGEVDRVYGPAQVATLLLDQANACQVLKDMWRVISLLNSPLCSLQNQSGPKLWHRLLDQYWTSTRNITCPASASLPVALRAEHRTIGNTMSHGCSSVSNAVHGAGAGISRPEHWRAGSS